MTTDSFTEELQRALAPAYTIQRELTGGGMSRVFVAVEESLGRTVVVKVLKPELGVGVNRERFRREIMLAAQLQHPHIVPVLNAGEHGELLWYTMPFVEGVSLRDSLAHVGKFSPRTVTRVLHDVLDALAYAHRRGVIHRDIKPGNILHHGSHSLVTDFGVAKALSASLPHSGTTSVGIAIGTPAYMAPEQLAADPNADHRMDLYAVGLLAYELLTGVQPFSGNSPQATMAAQLTRMPTPLEECCPGVPLELAALVMRLLAKHPDDRPPTAAAALAELESLTTPTMVPASGNAPAAATAAVGAPDEPTPAPPSGRSSRRSVVAVAAMLVLATIVVVFARTRGDGAARQSARATTIAAPQPRADRASAAPSVRLTHEDSLRIAEAVRSQMAKARLAGTPSPNGTHSLDSLQRTIVRAYTDSLRGARQVVLAPKPAANGAATSVVSEGTPARSSTTDKRTPAIPEPAAPGKQATTTRSATRAPTTSKAPIFARPRRVALLPIRDATLRAEVGPTARMLEDSLRKAVAAAGYTAATDGELLRLVSQPEMGAQRRLADSLGIGAIVTNILSMRSDEIVAQTLVVDVWRNMPISDRLATDLDKPQEALGAVRNVTRALERVSWRTRNDPKLVLVFDLENQTGIDSLGDVARQLTDSLRAVVVKQFGAQVVTDSVARATKDLMERRAVAGRLGTGALVVGTISRARGDSMTVRLAVRDMSEDRNLPNIDLRLPRDGILGSIEPLRSALLAQLGMVNWGPKQSR